MHKKNDDITIEESKEQQQASETVDTLQQEKPLVTIPPRLFERLVRKEKEFDEQGMSSFSFISLLLFIAMVLGFYIYAAYKFNLPLDIRLLFRPRWQ